MDNAVQLSSGWCVSFGDNLQFTAPDGVIYDRCGWLIVSRSSKQLGRYPKSVNMKEIFTEEEWEGYSDILSLSAADLAEFRKYCENCLSQDCRSMTGSQRRSALRSWQDSMEPEEDL